MKKVLALLCLATLLEANMPSFSAIFRLKSLAALTQVKVVGSHHKIAGTGYTQREEYYGPIDWSKPFASYKPIFFEHPSVLKFDRDKMPGGWADPVEFYKNPNFKKLMRKSFSKALKFDAEGRPLNPMGRTNIYGRGLLGKWGVNLAADPIITRINPATGKLEMLAIKRKDNGIWAIPGGMVDDGDSVSLTLAKEFEEECGINVPTDFMKNAKLIYEGYVDDPRNTDNAWIETVAKWLHLDENNPISKMTPIAGDDAAKAQWKELAPKFVNSLYASHPQIVAKVVELYNNK